jgi:hypothetical protein
MEVYMVYLAKKDGGVVHHTSLQALKDMDGIEAPDMTVTDEEFEAAGSLVRLIGDEIVLGKTEAEITAGENQKRIGEIDAELGDIDRKSGRPSRAVSFSVAKGKTPPAADVSKLDEYEKAAADLRQERASLLTAGVAG